jgi:hypothetical protein
VLCTPDRLNRRRDFIDLPARRQGGKTKDGVRKTENRQKRPAGFISLLQRHRAF